ncbi:MAG: YdiU family protein [Bacteroidia bacterium]|nr:YdiU family protein [Bacteroidia bacterium]
MSTLEYTYLTLPNKFFELVKPAPLSKPEIALLNQKLMHELGINTSNSQELLKFLQLAEPNPNAQTFAQAYAGHQFGHFTMLGDGRAVMVGEWVQTEKNRYDIQLKGGGRTKYSRGGDGKATYKAMLREYLISEAMFHLNIASSRSLAVIKTGDTVQREQVFEGAVLPRVMKSHIRVGTFEFARQFCTLEEQQALLDYTIERLYPELKSTQNKALELLNTVMHAQIKLIANWMRVGFIHGVMNTDNMAISAETFDYGPCAFMNSYHPNTVFSSIDRDGRYAFRNQANIGKWNLTRLAEALLPMIHSEQSVAVEWAQETLAKYDRLWVNQYYGTMLLKLGIEDLSSELVTWVNELLSLMEKYTLDYTNTFLALSNPLFLAEPNMLQDDFVTWRNRWENYIESSVGMAHARTIMSKNNPAFIPRNHLVEEALDSMIAGDDSKFKTLMQVVENPYSYDPKNIAYSTPPLPEFDSRFKTYCGT